MAQLLVAILGGDPEITVVGTAADGVDAVEQVAALRPDVITMDVRMPRMNGLDATKMIMNQQPAGRNQRDQPDSEHQKPWPAHALPTCVRRSSLKVQDTPRLKVA